MSAAFNNSFWEKDMVACGGFDILCKRMREGKNAITEIAEYAKQRAIIEENYAKQLIRLAQSMKVKDEVGTTRKAWDALKSQTEDVGAIHSRASSQLVNDIEKNVREFRARQKSARKETEEKVKKSQKNKVGAHEKMIKAKKTYETKCKERDQADEALKGSIPVKDVDKLKQKAKKAAEAAIASDSAYQVACSGLEETRKAWIEDFDNCCQHFQQLEEERIVYSRNTLWALTNICSSISVANDECYEKVRLALEEFSMEKDIQEFIRSKKLGYDRPEPIPYESYYGTTSASAASSSAQRSHENLLSAVSNSAPNASLPPPMAPNSTGAYPSAQTGNGGVYASVNISGRAPLGETNGGFSSSLTPTPEVSHYASVSVGARLAQQASPAGLAPTNSTQINEHGYAVVPNRAQKAAAAANTTISSVPNNSDSSEYAVLLPVKPVRTNKPLVHVIVEAIYEYKAQGEQELSFKEGDHIKVIEKEEELWWKGELDGRVGMFPVSFTHAL